jgi:hypothetical protein
MTVTGGWFCRLAQNALHTAAPIAEKQSRALVASSATLVAARSKFTIKVTASNG